MRKNGKNINKQGSVVVEFAVLIAFLLIPLVIGAWDAAQLVDINQVLTRAAREGVVLASRGDDPVASVQTYIQSAGLDIANLTMTVSVGADDPSMGQAVAISLSYDVADRTVYPWQQILPQGINTVAYAKME